jgi:intracellular sulfur oxidation DsrE/DsrF family protein
MKKLLLSFYFLFFIISSNVAQEKVDHKIIFQCSTSDTMAQKALMKQLGNILSVQPNTKIEIVCHGPGLNMLVDDKSVVKDKIKSFSDKGVIFNACEFSMKERNVDKSQVTSNVSFVSAGILYIVSKQEQGWSYIKAGF